MSQDELVRHVRQAASGPFAPEELNEVLLMVYNILGKATRDGADTLTVTPTAFRWTRADEPTGVWQTDAIPTTVSFRDELHRILARDTIVQRYVQLVEASDGIETFHLGEPVVAPRLA